MGPKDVLAERLRRLAEDLRFSHYVICPHCLGPVVLFPHELGALPVYLRCFHCNGAIPLDRASLREYVAGA